MPTPLARDQWYVAAYGTEVSRTFLARTILGEPIVFYRTAQDGRVVALADRCVHRRYPLSESRLDGDTIVCGYHGFTYDTSGTCVFVPGQQRIPRTARVASYPVAEVDSFVWVWIGDPELFIEDVDTCSLAVGPGHPQPNPGSRGPTEPHGSPGGATAMRSPHRGSK